MARRTTVVSMSASLEIRSERYGFVRKKSKEAAATIAPSAPAARPPAIAASTTTTTSNRTAVVCSMSLRTAKEAPGDDRETPKIPNKGGGVFFENLA